jgi:tetratricopeptide (TPR) repeat protein
LYVSKKKLQRALNKCNELIKEYPTSDKIDDAAYLAGEIHEFFKDYSIAVLYYKRAFQWDSQTPYPARYRAANLLDYQLFERDKALELYRESLQKEKGYLNSDTVTSIEQRIAELTVEPKSESIK